MQRATAISIPERASDGVTPRLGKQVFSKCDSRCDTPRGFPEFLGWGRLGQQTNARLSSKEMTELTLGPSSPGGQRDARATDGAPSLIEAEPAGALNSRGNLIPSFHISPSVSVSVSLSSLSLPHLSLCLSCLYLCLDVSLLFFISASLYLCLSHLPIFSPYAPSLFLCLLPPPPPLPRICDFLP